MAFHPGASCIEVGGRHPAFLPKAIPSGDEADGLEGECRDMNSCVIASLLSLAFVSASSGRVTRRCLAQAVSEKYNPAVAALLAW